MARLVERVVEDQSSVIVGVVERTVGQFANVLEQHRRLAGRILPVDRERLFEKILPLDAGPLVDDPAYPPYPFTKGVGTLGRIEDRVRIDCRELDRDFRILFRADADLTDRAGPLAAAAQHLLGFLAGNLRPDRAAIECREPARREALKRLFARHERGQ